MRANQAEATTDILSRYWSDLEKVDRLPRSIARQSNILDSELVERSAQALFEFVFSSCGRLDGKHQWVSCDEETKEGFRGEAKAVIVAAWPLLFR